MNKETTLTLLDLSRIYNRNRCIFCTWHTRYGMPYTSLHGNVARISIKDLLFFFDTQIRTSNSPKCWIDNKNTLLTYLKNQNTTPAMTTPSIVNSQSSIVNTSVQLDPVATIPTRAHETDVGYDVTSISLTAVLNNGARVTINQPETQLPDFACAGCHDVGYAVQYYEIDTGVHITPPAGYYFELVPNSRQAKTTVSWGNSIGIIDPTYTGSIKIIIKHAMYKDLARYLPGNVVGQLILRPMLSCTFTQVDHLTPTDRADGGFGSTATPTNS